MVQPFYIIDPNRASSLQELKTMQKICEAIACLDPEAAKRIERPKLLTVYDIFPDPDITAQFAQLNASSYMGEQYDWLARFAKQYGIPELELCLHVEDHAFLPDRVEETSDGSWRFKEGCEGAEAQLFGAFRFPILTLSKVEMRERAKGNGFGDLMQLTWFCHSPWKGEACGLCNPCIYTVEEGLGDRLSKMALLRYRLRSLFQMKQKGRNLLRQTKRSFFGREVDLARCLRDLRLNWPFST